MPDHPIIDLEQGRRLYVTAGPVNVCINATNEGVIVDVYNDREVLNTMSITYDEAWED